MSASQSPLLQCKLQCSVANVSEDETSEGKQPFSKVYEFQPDPHKKSAFWLGNNNSSNTRSDNDNSATNKQQEQRELYCMAHPAEAIFFGTVPWAIGGFQLVSNATSVKVYLTTNNTNDEGSQEKYLTVVKGLPVASTKDNAAKLFKAMCVIPGGVRPVEKVRLVFDILSDDGSNGQDEATSLKLEWIKLTARMVVNQSNQPPQAQEAGQRPQIPPSMMQQQQTQQQAQRMQQQMNPMMMQAMMASASSSSTAGQPHPTLNNSALGGGLFGMNTNPSNSANANAIMAAMMASSNNNNPPGPATLLQPQPPPNAIPDVATATDLSAHMAGLNFAVRSTEERLVQKMQASERKFEQLLLQQQQYIVHLQTMLQQQQAWIQDRMNRQEAWMEDRLSRQEAAGRRNGTTDNTTNGDSREPMEDSNRDNNGKEKSSHESSSTDPSVPLWQQYASLG